MCYKRQGERVFCLFVLQDKLFWMFLSDRLAFLILWYMFTPSLKMETDIKLLLCDHSCVLANFVYKRTKHKTKTKKKMTSKVNQNKTSLCL